MKSLLARLRADPPVDLTPTTPRVDPTAEPFRATPPGGTGRAATGVLVCHGFTGSPRSMRPWAEHLAAYGFTVSLPRLPGHATSWQELARTRWPDWYGHLDREFAALRERCDRVFVVGLSMGGALALRLAELHGPAVAGLVLVNPAVTTTDRMQRYVLPWLWHLVPSVRGIAGDIAKPGADEGGYDRTPLAAAYSMRQLDRLVADDLPAVVSPLLLYRSAVDHVVDPSSARLILARVSSGILRERVLSRSYHVATLDHDADTIFTGSTAFIDEVTRATTVV